MVYLLFNVYIVCVFMCCTTSCFFIILCGAQSPTFFFFVLRFCPVVYVSSLFLFSLAAVLSLGVGSGVLILYFCTYSVQTLGVGFALGTRLLSALITVQASGFTLALFYSNVIVHISAS